MSNVISLALHKNDLARRQRKKARKRLLETARVLTRHTQIDGFALVTFTIEDNGKISNGVHYDVPTASLTYILPHMAQQALFTSIIGGDNESD